MTGEDEKAVTYLLRVFNRDKHLQRDLNLNMKLAVSYRKLKKYDLSLQYIERVEGLNRNSSELFFHKGLVYYETREYSKALGCFFSSFKLDPENDTVAFHIGKVYEAMGKTEEEEKYLKLSRQLEEKAKLLEEQGEGVPSTAKEQ
jgi:tetratricopeptide (TPR) repeat protein